MAIDLQIVDDYEALSLHAARAIARAIESSPDLVVLAATGRTPTGAYENLAARYRSGGLNTSRMTVVQLDEYVDLDPDDRRSLLRWTERVLIDPIEVPRARVISFQPSSADAIESCRAYEDAVRSTGGIDLAILGLGPNGHLGFNEPPSGPDDPTRVVQLADASIASNAAYWGSTTEVPSRAMTAGMDIILSTKKILLLVSGEHKADILRRTLEDDASNDVPASYLRHASDVTVIADVDASRSLRTHDGLKALS